MSRPTPVRLALLAFFLVSAALPVHAQTFYWESPQIRVAQGMTHSSSAAGKSIMALAWQDIRPTDSTSGNIFVSLAVSRDGITWTQYPRIEGPIHYTGVTAGNEPRVYSMTVDQNDRILMAVAMSDHDTVILQSSDAGASFQQLHRLQAAAVTGNPNLFLTGKGGLLLLLSEGRSESSVALAFSHSPDGRSWSDIAPLVSATDGVGNPQLQPAHAVLGGREYIVFQALKEINALAGSWQLYLKTSLDGGATWGKAIEITTISPLFGDEPRVFNNQRPRIAASGGRLGLIWERSRFGEDRPTIYSVSLDSNGAIVGGLENPATSPPAQFAHILSVRDQEYVLYADASNGVSRIVLARKNGKAWDTQPLLNTETLNAVFPHAVIFKGSPFIFWENQLAAGAADSLVELRPLTSVGSPVLKPVDFAPGQLANRDTLTVSWSEPQPPDPAGILKYQYTWTWSDGKTTVEKERGTVSAVSSGPRLFSTRKLDLDGTWTFSVTATDIANNTSATPATVAFTRDATPPKPVAFEVIGKDGKLLLTESADGAGKPANELVRT